VKDQQCSDPGVDIAVVYVPHIAHATDFQYLNEEPYVRVRYVKSKDSLGAPDAIILPGTTSATSDLDYLRRAGLASAVTSHVGRTPILGVCGGFEMFGRTLHDPKRMESALGTIPGMGLLDIDIEYRLAGIAEDVTDLKAAEEKARRLAVAEASVRARDEVLAVVAHDLRNPLNAIAMAARLLQQQPQMEVDRRARHAQTIERAVHTADRLISDLLDVARIEAGQLVVEPQAVEVGPLLSEVQDVFQLIARDKGLTLECEVVDGIPRIAADRERLLQVIGNLVGNAVKFTPSGGRIGVQARSERDCVEISVSDTGPGIPREALLHVFDRFSRGRPAERRGLGLGLAIVQGIVEAHHGRVWAESEPGSGSTFRFTIPRAAEEQRSDDDVARRISGEPVRGELK
jgi:signal transduction histidine kinase